MTFNTTDFFKKHSFVVSVLFVSGLLRWILIFRGGQFYFPDESRYGIAQDALALLLDGKVKTALLTLAAELAHIGFKVTALIPALFEKIFAASLALPAVFFSFFSVLSLLLVWMIARRAGASERVTNYALFLAAGSQVLLYYARHLFPYDQALFFGLLALYVALGSNKPSASFWCGALSFLCIVTYNGYWTLAAFPPLVNLLQGAKEKDWLMKRPVYLGFGFLTPLLLLLLACVVIGKDVFSDYGTYLRKIVQGSFREGWSLPFEFFWHAEHGFFFLVGLFSLVALFLFLKRKDKVLWVAFGGILFVYLSLVITSNFTHTFVVYGRTARQLMPFLVLAAAYGLSILHSWKLAGPWLANGLLALVLVQAAWNYRQSYQLVYPREFLRQVEEHYPDFQVSANMMRFYAPLVCRNGGLVAKNFHYIYDWQQTGSMKIQGEVLMEAPHPIHFLPYQYDGFSPREREAIRKRNFQMALYRPDAGSLEKYKNEIEPCYQAKNAD